jgi:peroxin-1
MVEPVSEDDWELVELHTEYLEQQILNQINIIFPGEEFPLHIKQNPIKLRIGIVTLLLLLE